MTMDTLTLCTKVESTSTSLADYVFSSCLNHFMNILGDPPLYDEFLFRTVKDSPQNKHCTPTISAEPPPGVRLSFLVSCALLIHVD